MEVITIDSDAFNKIIGRINDLENKFSQIVKIAYQPLGERWLDNQEVCQLLNISKRTLQYYREESVIAYSMIRHKVFYKASDVDALLKSNYHKARKQRG